MKMTHYKVSIIKSSIRLLFCLYAIIFNSLYVLAAGVLVAEILGIYEELVEETKDID